MKRYILPLALAISLSAASRQRSEMQMLNIAREALQMQPATRASVYQLQPVVEEAQLKVFATEGLPGFVVVSRDDIFPEVLGISDTPFDASDMPDALRIWIKDVSATMQRHLDTQYVSLPYESVADMASPSNVANFVTTTWGQGLPYNHKTPDSNGRLTATGCVATAMAQIFKYYEYPAKINTTGGYSYTVNVSGNPKEYTQKLWFNNTPYDWAAMRDSYSEDDPESDPSVVAVDNLMRDCGYTVHMEYHYTGSAAQGSNVPYAAAHNFRYDSLSIGYMERFLYTDKEWLSAVYGELAQRHPILYAAIDMELGGHAFVLSGMHPDGKVYVNWGWDGKYNGFFNIELLKPDPKGMEGAFTEAHHMSLGFRPEIAHPSGKRQEHAHSLFLLDEFTVEAKNDSLYVNGGIYNYQWRTFYGDLWMSLAEIDNPDNSFDIIMMNNGEDAIDYLYGYGVRNYNYFKAFEGEKIPAGKYYFSVKSHADDEDETQLGRMYDLGSAAWVVTINNKGQVADVKSMDPDEASVVPVTAPKASNTTTLSHGSAETYDLSGRRTASNSRGIVVRDGRKYLRK